MQSYDRSRVLIPTLGDDTEYGAAPAPPPKASRQQGDGYGRAKMVVAALGGAAMLAVAGLRGNSIAAPSDKSRNAVCKALAARRDGTMIKPRASRSGAPANLTTPAAKARAKGNPASML